MRHLLLPATNDERQLKPTSARWSTRGDDAPRQPSLDLLVLNAGVMALPSLERTADGFERQIGVNHFGHALLTRLLRPALDAKAAAAAAPAAGDGPRVVTVASTAHTFGTVDVGDLHYSDGGERKYSAWGAYGQSKLANVLFAKGKSERTQNERGRALPCLLQSVLSVLARLCAVRAARRVQRAPGRCLSD